MQEVLRSRLDTPPDLTRLTYPKITRLRDGALSGRGGGPERIRVNTVNSGVVLSGSKIWGSSLRQERAAAYGIEPDELEEHYRQRNVLRVDGGVRYSYPR